MANNFVELLFAIVFAPVLTFFVLAWLFTISTSIIDKLFVD